VSAGLEVVLDQMAALLHRELGLRLDPAMLSRLRRCLRDESAERRQEPAEYATTLKTDAAARQDLYNRVTVQETSFFRHPGQFEALATQILPALDGPVTIWSAACANGQEAYSLAMVLHEQGRQGTVIASDVSTKALGRTAAARYQTRELTGLSAARRDRYLVAGPDDWEICRTVHDRVSVQRHNQVVDPIPDNVARCQVVFCRNVLIYFSSEQATAFLTRLAQRLPPGACLFLGYAETIWQVTDLFEPVRIGEAFEFHRRREPVARTAARSLARDRRPDAPIARPDRKTAAKATGRTARETPRRRVAVVPVAAAVTAPATGAEQAAELARAGQASSAKGDHQAAIAAFRKCVYLGPDDPMGYVHLGLALEASGDRAAAARAFQSARAALGRGSTLRVDPILDGYRVEELTRLLDSKQEALER
jgi:chemotaxis methyl-accepting protein methylase